eukprot:GFYU01044510.1.p1 GENE.GFYU01044510.1~~GFYU01044510.1.p1  ORF type:complete len:220 (+),score=37.96 GFYU01044510.1:92-661(+)
MERLRHRIFAVDHDHKEGFEALREARKKYAEARRAMHTLQDENTSLNKNIETLTDSVNRAQNELRKTREELDATQDDAKDIELARLKEDLDILTMSFGVPLCDNCNEDLNSRSQSSATRSILKRRQKVGVDMNAIIRWPLCSQRMARSHNALRTMSTAQRREQCACHACSRSTSSTTCMAAGAVLCQIW